MRVKCLWWEWYPYKKRPKSIYSHSSPSCHVRTQWEGGPLQASQKENLTFPLIQPCWHHYLGTSQPTQLWEINVCCWSPTSRPRKTRSHMVNSAVFCRALLQHPLVCAHDVRAADPSGTGGGERDIFGGKNAQNNLCIVIEFRIEHLCLERQRLPNKLLFHESFPPKCLCFPQGSHHME